MNFHSFDELEKALPQIHAKFVFDEIGVTNVDWILDNHHLYSTSEIMARCKISRPKLVHFFRLCGISTEYIYSAEYTTPRIQGELAGRARVEGYKVEGHTITRGDRFSMHIEQEAIGVGFRVFDEYGNELVYPEINRPKVLATEYSNAIDLSDIKDEAAKRVEAVKVAIVKDAPSGKRSKPIRVLQRSKNSYKQIVSSPEPEKKMRQRKGYFYSETYNKGHGHVATRFVGEIMVNRHRYRFRSTNSINVQRWLDDMLAQYSEY